MKSKYDDSTIYMIVCLWLHGFSEAEAARFITQAGIMALTKGRVSGIIDRHGQGKLRNLNREDRQAWLDRMKTARLDKGRLADWTFTARDTASRRSGRRR